MKSDIWIHNKAQQKIPVGRKYCTLLYMCTKIEFLLFGSRKYACELCVWYVQHFLIHLWYAFAPSTKDEMA